jgi:hypothetical protein
MRVRAQAIVLSLLAMSMIAVAGAQIRSSTSTTAVQHEVAAQVTSPANGGAGFQLICRGGQPLRVGSSDVRHAPAMSDLPPWILISTMTVDFDRSAQAPDRSGRNLRPGECSPAGFQLRDTDPTRLQSDLVTNGQWKRGRDGLPEDRAPNVAERYPDAHSISEYLKDANHYWSFLAGDSGQGYLHAYSFGYWKPEFYKGPETSSTYSAERTIAAIAGSAGTTTQATTSRYREAHRRIEGRYGTPSVPSPAIPAPPPVVYEPAQSVLFNPPLLQDGEQLWACADAAAGEANADACSGEESAQAYCRLRDAQSGPDLVIADAQPDVPVRAVNGDVCAEELCRIVHQLQCDR